MPLSTTSSRNSFESFAPFSLFPTVAELSSRFVSKEGNVKGSSKGSFASLLSPARMLASFGVLAPPPRLYEPCKGRRGRKKRLRRMVEEWWRNIGGERRERSGRLRRWRRLSIRKVFRVSMVRFYSRFISIDGS